MDTSRSDHERKETGSALVLAIFVLAILGSMAVALLSLSQMELRMSQGNLQLKKSFFMAEAGQEDARVTLFAVNGKGSFDDDLSIAAGADGVIDFDPDAIELLYDGRGNVTGLTGFDDDFPLRPLQTFGDGWYAAFLTNDPADGVASTGDTNGRVMLTGIGANADRSLEIVQAIVEPNPILPTMPPATITLLGPTPDFQGGTSNPFEYDGDDCPAGVSGLAVPVVGTVGPAAEAAAELGVAPQDNYTSGSYAGLDTIADLTDPGEPTVADSGYGTLDAAWTDCSNVLEIIEELRESATHTCCTPPVCDPPVPSSCVLPLPSLSNLVFVDGDLSLGGSDDGSGTLVVTGDLAIDGGLDWEGMVLVLGSGGITRSGTGNGQISGAIMIADVAGTDDVYGTGDDCTGGDDGFGVAEFLVSGGGNGRTAYCSDHILAAQPVRPYRIVSFLQR